MALPLARIRRIAAEEQLVEILYSESRGLISFVPPDFQPGDPQVNVYYKTGTVGTCLDHFRQGRTQIFRRNVDLDMLRSLFRDQRVHIGEELRDRQRRRPRQRCSECRKRTALTRTDCGHNELCLECADGMEAESDHHIWCSICKGRAVVLHDSMKPRDEAAAAHEQLAWLQERLS